MRTRMSRSIASQSCAARRAAREACRSLFCYLGDFVLQRKIPQDHTAENPATWSIVTVSQYIWRAMSYNDIIQCLRN